MTIDIDKIRSDFESEFPLAVWDATVGGYTQPMYTYALQGYRLGRASTPPSTEGALEGQAAGWISVADRLPWPTPLPDGSTPFVLVKWKRESRADNLPDIDVSNVVYLARNAANALYWMPIPAAPQVAPAMKERTDVQGK